MVFQIRDVYFSRASSENIGENILYISWAAVYSVLRNYNFFKNWK